MYKAEGPSTEARNADTTPEPLPTSKHTLGLKTQDTPGVNDSVKCLKNHYGMDGWMEV